MHSESGLAEGLPMTNERRQLSSGQQRGLERLSSTLSNPGSTIPDLGLDTSTSTSHQSSVSSPIGRDTASSASTSTTHSNNTATTSNDLNPYGIEHSPNAASQSSFSARDGADGSQRRGGASRRRTGPLSAEQREKAALIRRVGACESCRRRRVACHPNHHNMTWEDALRKYRTGSPTQDLAPLSARQTSPRHSGFAAINHSRPPTSHEISDQMDVDSTPTPIVHPIRKLSQGDSRTRTPLPSGPRLERIAAQASRVSQTAHEVHNPRHDHHDNESVQTQLQAMASKISSNPYRSRYNAVQALLLYWEDDEDQDVGSAVNELADVLEKHYQYVSEIKAIPVVSQDGKSSWRWLSQKVTAFVDNRDERDVLKIIYYVGQSHLDSDREMVLAFDREKGPTIRWSGIQQILEDAHSDTLIVMDAAYYPSSKFVRQQGVLEVVAASASEDHFAYLDRTSFTREITEQLRARASQKFFSPFTAAELHAKLLSNYPRMFRERNPEKRIVTSAPSPLHVQISANTRLPSVLLAPVRRALPMCVEPDSSAPQLNLTIRLSDDALHLESWAEWLRSMPDGIKDVKVEGPYQRSSPR